MKIKAPANMPEAKQEQLSVLYEDGFLRIPQIIGDKTATPVIPPIVPVSKSTLWAWVKAGKFPAPIRLGLGTTAWRISDVQTWIKSSASAGNAQ